MRERYGPGESAGALRPGDFILTHGEYRVSKIIRFGQGLRHDKRHAYYNHAALVLNRDGDLAEALGDGVVRTNISRYTPKEYSVVRIHAWPWDRAQILDFAENVLENRHEYGYLTIASLAFTLATGSSLVVARAGTAICSGFVSDALTRAGYIFERPPAHMMPADLAKHFNVIGGG